MAKDASRQMEVSNDSSRPTLSSSVTPRREDVAILPELRLAMVPTT